MAKIYDEKEIENLERQAALKQRQDAAIKILNPENRDPVAAMKTMTADERVDFMNQRDKERTDKWHQANAEARERRLAGMREIAKRDPGRYSSQIFAPTLSDGARAALAYLERQENRPEEARRFDVGQQTERFKAEQEAAGKINYGKGAAEVKAGADITMNNNEWETRAKIAEQEAAAKKYLAEQGAAAQKYGIDAEHGKIGEDGKVTPGSRERTAQIQGESEVQKQEAANKGLLAQAEITRQNKEKELANVLDKAMIEAGSKANSDMNAKHAKIIAAALGTMSDMNDVSDVFKKLTEQYKDDPDMMKSLGVVRQQMENPEGQQTQKNVVTDAKGAKWQVIYDENGKPVGKKPIK